jgi:hypothetical protein
MTEKRFPEFHRTLETGYGMYLVKTDENIIIYSMPVKNLFFKTITIILAHEHKILSSLLITKDGIEIKGVDVEYDDIENHIEIKRALHRTLLPYKDTDIALFPKTPEFASCFGEYLTIVGMDGVRDYSFFHDFERFFTEAYDLSDSTELRILARCVMISSLSWTGFDHMKFFSEAINISKSETEESLKDFTLFEHVEYSGVMRAKFNYYMKEILRSIENNDYFPGYTFHSFFVSPLSFEEKFDESSYDFNDYKEFAIIFREALNILSKHYVETLI